MKKPIIRVHSLSGDLYQEKQLTNKEAHRLVPLTAIDEVFLIEEAIRFYNFGIRPSQEEENRRKEIEGKKLLQLYRHLENNFYLTKRNFRFLEAARFRQDLKFLGQHFNRRIYNQLKILTNVKVLRQYLSEEIAQSKYYKLSLKDWYPASVFPVRLLAFKHWRNANMNNRGFIFYDELAGIYQDIQAVTAPTFFLKTVQQYYQGRRFKIQPGNPFNSHTIYFPEGNLKHNRRKLALILSKYGQGIYDMRPQDIGLTEKLYAQLSLEPFHQSYKNSIFSKDKHIDIQGTPLQRQSVELEKTLKQILGLKKGKRYLSWPGQMEQYFQGIIKIEQVFSRLSATAFYNSPKVNWPNATELFSFYYHQVGFPLAFFFTGYLRLLLLKWIVEGIIFHTNLPEIYRDLNGYMAFALKELLINQPSHHIFYDNLGTHNFPIFMHTDKSRAEWIAKGVLAEKFDNAQWLTEKVQVTKPLFKWKIDRNFPFNNESIDLLAPNADPVNYFTPFQPKINPPLLKTFYEISNLRTKIGYSQDLRRHFTRSEAIYGARFIAQAHIYVACQLLKKSKEEASVLPPGFNDHFHIGSGSFALGGKFPPHITHRDGYAFDWDYLANVKEKTIEDSDLPHWPLLEKTEMFVEYAQKIQEKRKLTKEVSKLENKINQLRSQPETTKKKKEIATQSQKLEDKKAELQNLQLVREWKPGRDCKDFVGKTPVTALNTPFVSLPLTTPITEDIRLKPDSFLFRDFLVKPMKKEFKKLESTYFNQSNPSEEETPFNDLEKQLIGTPVFSNKTIGESFVYAHAAVVLSGPLQSIWASPRSHLKVLRALARVYRQVKNKRVREAIDALVRTFELSFMPNNHHNHWHNEYWYENVKAIKRWEKALGANNTPIKHFQQNFGFWYLFGIDFNPLIKHFEFYKQKIRQSGRVNLATRKANKDLDIVIKVLQDYEAGKDQFWKELKESDPVIDPNIFWIELKNIINLAEPKKDTKNNLVDKAVKCSKSYYNHVLKWALGLSGPDAPALDKGVLEVYFYENELLEEDFVEENKEVNSDSEEDPNNAIRTYKNDRVEQ